MWFRMCSSRKQYAITIVVLLSSFIFGLFLINSRYSARPTSIFFEDTFFGTIISRNQSGWYRKDELCSGKETFVRAELREPQRTPIYVYPEVDDEEVSKNIIHNGIWERDFVIRIHNILEADTDLVFLDIGANVGAFSLTAAKLGRRVVACDLLVENVARLCESMKDGGLEKNMIIIHNALSHIRGKVNLRYYEGNVGATYIDEVVSETSDNSSSIDAILLDDVLEIMDLKRVVIKMDAERFEHNIIKGGKNFFAKVQVEYLLIEWAYHSGQNSGDFIICFLEKHNLKPEIQIQDQSQWPSEVWFRRVS